MGVLSIVRIDEVLGPDVFFQNPIGEAWPEVVYRGQPCGFDWMDEFFFASMGSVENCLAQDYGVDRFEFDSATGCSFGCICEPSLLQDFLVTRSAVFPRDGTRAHKHYMNADASEFDP